MTEIERAWFEYGQHFLVWKRNRQYLMQDADEGVSYSDLRRALPKYGKAAQNAWTARCRAIKLRKESEK